jgi:hypothetical protein
MMRRERQWRCSGRSNIPLAVIYSENDEGLVMVAYEEVVNTTSKTMFRHAPEWDKERYIV